MSTTVENELLEASAAAAILGLSAASVRLLAVAGHLPCQQTTTGSRIYRRGDVEQLAAARARAGAPRVTRRATNLRKGA